MLHPGAAIFGVILNVIALTWVLDLEKNGCPCVNDWRRKVIKYWHFLALAMPLILMIITPPRIVTAAIGLLGLLAFGALASTLWSIQRQKCQCAQDWREKVLVVTTSLTIVGLVLGGLK